MKGIPFAQLAQVPGDYTADTVQDSPPMGRNTRVGRNTSKLKTDRQSLTERKRKPSILGVLPLKIVKSCHEQAKDGERTDRGVDELSFSMAKVDQTQRLDRGGAICASL